MITSKQLSILKNMELGDIDVPNLPAFKDISIDTSLPVPERVTHYLEQVENPYCFRFEDICVKIDFSNRPISLQQVLTDFLIRKKNSL